MGEINYRGKEWVFNALWAASGSIVCNVNIPLTIIFRNGEPCKGIGMAGGTEDKKSIVKISIGEQNFPDCIDKRSSTHISDVCRKLLLDYQRKNNYDSCQGSHVDPIFCKVTYVDSEQEDLTIEQMDLLMQSESWRIQIMLLQGYVPLVDGSHVNGLYKTTSDSGLTREEIILKRNQMTDVEKLTRSIAEAAESAYMVSGSSLSFTTGPSDSSDHRKNHAVINIKKSSAYNRNSQANNSISILKKAKADSIFRILNLSAYFGKDSYGRHFFLYSDYVTAEVGKAEKYQDVESYLKKEKDGREALAAGKVLVELRDLLLHSQRRGLSPSDSFAHFDERRSGAVNLNDFTRGLASLRMGVTKRVGELVMQTIAGASSKFLTSRDFEDLLFQYKESLLISSSSFVNLNNSAGGNNMIASRQNKQQQQDWNPGLQASSLADTSQLLSLTKMRLTSQDNVEYKDSERGIQEANLLHQSSSVRRVVDGIPFVRRTCDGFNRRGLNRRNMSTLRKEQKERRKAWTMNSNVDKNTKVQQSTISLLSNIAQEILDEQSASQCSDELLHLDDGVVMTYRILTQPKSKNNIKSDISGVETFNSRDSKSESSSSSDIASSNFTFIVVPDLCMTLDTLQLNLESLLLMYPSACLVLVGLPGLPNTLWPSHVVLDPELHSKCIGRLILQLYDTNRLYSSATKDREEERGPIFMMGFGTGAFSLLRFVSLLLPNIQWLEVKAVCIINSVITLSKEFKRICAELYQQMSGSTDIEEMGEILCSLHLWKEFVMAKGKNNCMEHFWNVRQDLCSNQLGQRGKEVSYIGILEQLRGILLADPKDFDGASVLLTDLPVVVVQGTEDVFVNPRGASIFQSSQMPPERFQVDNISCCLAPGAVHISWLQAGHEILQEKYSFLLALIGRLVQAGGISPSEGMNAIQVPHCTVPTDAKEDIIIDIDANILQPRLDGLNRSMLDQVREGFVPLPFLSNDRPKSDFIQRDDNSLTSPSCSEEKADIQLPESPQMLNLIDSNDLTSEDGVSLPGTASVEKRKKLVLKSFDASRKNSEEREKTNLITTARAAVDRRRLMMEQDQEAKELSAMSVEEGFSIAIEVETKRAYTERVRIERRRKERLELAESTREAQIKNMEEESRREKKQKAMSRRTRSEELLQAIAVSEEIIDSIAIGIGRNPATAVSSELEGPPSDLLLLALGSTSREVDVAMIADTYWALKDFSEGRERIFEVRKQISGMQIKAGAVKSLREKVDGECRRIKRALKMMEGSPSLIGGGFDALKEIIKLKKSLKVKSKELSSLISLLSLKTEEIDAVNTIYRRGEEESSEVYDRITILMKEMRSLEIASLNSVSTHRAKLQVFQEEKRKCQSKQTAAKIRHDAIRIELKRIESCDNDFIDTDVWVGGYMQRTRTHIVVVHLNKEIEALTDQLNVLKEVIEEIETKMSKVNFDLRKERRVCDRICTALRYFSLVIQSMTSTPVDLVVSQLSAMYSVATDLERRKESDDNATKAAADLGASPSSASERVRLKALEHRDKDERLFVALDLAMHPQCYSHLTPIEVHMMMVDKDYHSDLTNTDLKRIQGLPSAISLALPFLHSLLEVEAHRLLNKFLRSLGDEELKTMDYETSVPIISQATTTITNRRPSLANVSAIPFIVSIEEGLGTATDVEGEYEILLKESLRDRVRCLSKYVGAHTNNDRKDINGTESAATYEEIAWLQLERTLSPHLYLPSFSASDVKDNPNQPNEYTRWVNPFDIHELHEIINIIATDDSPCRDGIIVMNTDQRNCSTDDDLKVAYLLRKYYVPLDEGILGRSRLLMLVSLASSLATHLKKSFVIEEAEEGLQSTGIDTKKERELKQRHAIEDAKLWGSSSTVHPGSAGVFSQSRFFSPSTYSAARDHPAAFGLRANLITDDVVIFDDKLQDEDCAHEMILPEVALGGLDILMSLPKKNFKEKIPFDQRQWVIVNSLSALSVMAATDVMGKEVLIINQETSSLYTDFGTLTPRQSRAHQFSIPDKNDLRVLDITVSVVFQGDFGPQGYGPGRLAASLFRLPDSASPSSPPQPVGYAPYPLQSLNVQNSMGRIVIVHKPAAQPLRPGSFRLVVGSAATTHYSVQVNCHYSQSALPLVDKEIGIAILKQVRLKICIEELDNLSETSRLGERKVGICKAMVLEAEAESKRAQIHVQGISRRLQRDNEIMLLTEKDRMELEADLSVVEAEYLDLATLHITRSKEAEDITAGLADLRVTREGLDAEKIELMNFISKARSELPGCMAVLRSAKEAASVAAKLNAPSPRILSEGGHQGDGSPAITESKSPAEEVRERCKCYGFISLSLQEKQWSLLDRSLNPDKYVWFKEQEEAEQLKTSVMRGDKLETISIGQGDITASLDNFRLEKQEIEHILKAPFAMLSRKEIAVRKLLAKIHSNEEVVNEEGGRKRFDPYLAERTRAKQPATFNKAEKEWASMDKILHPEVWKYYGLKDPEEAFQERIKAKNPDGAGLNPLVETGEGGSGFSDQAKQMSLISKFLGIDKSTTDSVNDATTGAFDLNLFVSATRRTMTGGEKVWKCVWTKEQILKIWQTPRRKLINEEQHRAFSLLQEFNGTYKAYHEANVGWRVQMDDLSTKQEQLGSHIDWTKGGKIAISDVDLRARRILREIDRAASYSTGTMDSSSLHVIDQRFPIKVLKEQLEKELDVLLGDQVRDGEMARKRNVDSSDSEGDGCSDGSGGVSDDIDDEDIIGDMEEMMRAKAVTERRNKRSVKKEKARQHQIEIDQIISKHNKKDRKKHMNGYSLAENLIALDLGAGGCVACRNNPCLWRPCIDIEVCLQRSHVLEDEIRRVKVDPLSTLFESTVCLSAELGGETKFNRANLIYELQREMKDLNQEIQLNYIDKELHDAYGSRKEYVTVEHLHGYKTMLWTNNARIALQARQSRLIALTVAKGVVDDVLDHMLEGWYFGERESEFTVLGHVPSLQSGKGERIRAGQDQIRTIGAAMEKMKVRAVARKNGILLDEFRRGGTLEKGQEIEWDSQFNLEKERLAKEGRDHDHMLNETETTLRFGVFMMTLMYFRVMTFLKREQVSWGGDEKELSVTKGKGIFKKAVTKLTNTKERMRIVDEERNAEARVRRLDTVMIKYRIGEERRRDRAQRLRKEEVRKMVAATIRNRLEVNSVKCLQRVVRGYISRKNVFRWALKRAEWEAMKMVMKAAATKVQKTFRGYQGRLHYRMLRTQIAQFIAIVRFQEAEADEEEYWAEHPWGRFKREKVEWMKKKYNFDERIFAGKGLGAPTNIDKETKNKLRDRVAENKRAFGASSWPDDGLVDENEDVD